MFWDGYRWVEERPVERVAAKRRPRPRRRGVLLTVVLAVVVLAVMVPLLPVNASTATLAVKGNAVPGATLTVTGAGFNGRTWIQILWDGSATGMPLAQTSNQGRIGTSFRIPANATPGAHVVGAGQFASWTRRASSSPAALASADVIVLDLVAAPISSMTDAPTLTASSSPTQVAASTSPSTGPTSSQTPGSTPTQADTATPTDAPTRAPTRAPTGTTSPTQAAGPAPTSGPGTTPDPVPVPTPAPTPLACGVLQDRIDATAAGSTLDLTGCTFTAGATIAKPLALVGATIRVPASQKGLVVTSSGVTLDHLTILGAHSTTYNAAETGIYANGSAASPIVNLVIRNSQVGVFGQSAVWLRHVSSVTVTSNTIHDTVYAGIMILSGLGGTISHNTVQRIGVVGSGANSGNAYGIALSDTEAPATSGISVDRNTVTDVPTWHALDTHGGRNLSFTNNTVLRSSRGIFITTDNLGNRATGVLVQGNNLGSPAPVTFNLAAVTTYDADQVTITGNSWSAGWGGSYFGDYQGLSTNLVVSNNTVS